MTSPRPDPGQGLNAAIAAELRAERAAQDRTVKHLAEQVGVHAVSLTRYLKAQRHIDVELLAALCQALGTTPAEIVTAAQERVARESGYAADGPRVFGSSDAMKRTVRDN